MTNCDKNPGKTSRHRIVRSRFLGAALPQNPSRCPVSRGGCLRSQRSRQAVAGTNRAAVETVRVANIRDLPRLHASKSDMHQGVASGSDPSKQ